MLALELMNTTFVEMQESASPESWFPSLITETLQEGFAVVAKLSQKGEITTLPDISGCKALRSAHVHDPLV